MIRRSGLQSDVLALYHQLLRAAAKKDPSPDRKFVKFVQREFRHQAGLLARNDFRGIEHALRYGHKQIKLINMPGFDTASKV